MKVTLRLAPTNKLLCCLLCDAMLSKDPLQLTVDDQYAKSDSLLMAPLGMFVSVCHAGSNLVHDIVIFVHMSILHNNVWVVFFLCLCDCTCKQTSKVQEIQLLAQVLGCTEGIKLKAI